MCNKFEAPALPEAADAADVDGAAAAAPAKSSSTKSSEGGAGGLAPGTIEVATLGGVMLTPLFEGTQKCRSSKCGKYYHALCLKTLEPYVP